MTINLGSVPVCIVFISICSCTTIYILPLRSNSFTYTYSFPIFFLAALCSSFYKFHVSDNNYRIFRLFIYNLHTFFSYSLLAELCGCTSAQVFSRIREKMYIYGKGQNLPHSSEEQSHIVINYFLPITYFHKRSFFLSILGGKRRPHLSMQIWRLQSRTNRKAKGTREGSNKSAITQKCNLLSKVL